jgi:hypothetical protein
VSPVALSLFFPEEERDAFEGALCFEALRPLRVAEVVFLACAFALSALDFRVRD